MFILLSESSGRILVSFLSLVYNRSRRFGMRLCLNKLAIDAINRLIKVYGYAAVVELVDTRDSKFRVHYGRAGSIPARGTTKTLIN